jgi:hypothetical protein
MAVAAWKATLTLAVAKKKDRILPFLPSPPPLHPSLTLDGVFNSKNALKVQLTQDHVKKLTFTSTVVSPSIFLL